MTRIYRQIFAVFAAFAGLLAAGFWVTSAEIQRTALLPNLTNSWVDHLNLGAADANIYAAYASALTAVLTAVVAILEA